MTTIGENKPEKKVFTAEDILDNPDVIKQATGQEEVKEEKNTIFDKNELNKEAVVDKDSLPSVAKEAGSMVTYEQTHIDKRTGLDKSRFSDEELVITPEEKRTFIDSVISGSRYTMQFKLYGGRLTCTIRSRTSMESKAITDYIKYSFDSLDTYSALAPDDITFCILATQVEELNGVHFPELQKPYFYIALSGGGKDSPGWISAVDDWRHRPDHLTQAIAKCIQLFEYKYWSMIDAAQNANFWNPDTSTGI